MVHETEVEERNRQDDCAKSTRVTDNELVDVDAMIGDWDNRFCLNPSPPETGKRRESYGAQQCDGSRKRRASKSDEC